MVYLGIITQNAENMGQIVFNIGTCLAVVFVSYVGCYCNLQDISNLKNKRYEKEHKCGILIVKMAP